MRIKKINVITGEETDCSKETMRYIMNRYTVLDKIREAETFMLLLLEPDWCLLHRFRRKETN